jgi:3D (Asp-Asp-Asp) domain-containing protein
MQHVERQDDESPREQASRSDAACAAEPWITRFMPIGLAVLFSAVSAIVVKELVVSTRMQSASAGEITQVAMPRVDHAENEVSAVRASNVSVVLSPLTGESVALRWKSDADAGPILDGMGGELHGPPAYLAGGFVPDPLLRWFDGRPAKPARVQWMTVTAYSPDERSCGDSADGVTATLHCVTTNGGLLVAADPKVLPYGSMLTIPGYGAGIGTQGEEPAIVPVLDCGGAIKGYRLDVLFPTHEEAMRWGVQHLPVTVWEYADGGEMTNPRRVR